MKNPSLSPKLPRSARLIFSLSLLAGASFWIIDSLVDVEFFGEGTFYQQLLHPTAFEIWERLVVLLLFAAVGILAAYLIARMNRVQGELKDSQHLLHETQRVSHLGTVVLRRDLQIISISVEAKRVMGLDPGTTPDHLGGWVDGLEAADRQHFSSLIQEAVTRKSASHANIRCRSGRNHNYIHVRTVPQLTESGQLDYILCTVLDITANKRTEQALRDSERKLLMLIRAIPDSLMVTDQKGMVLNYLPSQYGLQWLSRDETVGRSFYQYIPAEASRKAQQIIERVIDSGEVEVLHFSMTIKGKPRHIEVRFSARGGPTVLWVIRDVTSRQETEIALQKSEDQYRKLTRELLSFQDRERERVSDEIHDSLGQQLLTLILHNEMLLKNASSSNGSLTDELKYTDDLLRQALEECRRISFQLSPRSVEKLGLVRALEEVINTFNRSQSEAEIEFINEFGSNPLGEQRDVVLFRVFQEAFSNVHKHSRANSVTIRLFPREGSVCLEVQDNGIGFDFNDSAVDAANIRLGEGLGLISMRERIESINGLLIIHSKPGEGTLISATIPVEKVET